MTEELGDDAGRVVDVLVEPEDDAIAVDATLCATVEPDVAELDAIQRRLAVEVGAPLTLRATVLQVKHVEIEARPNPIKVGDGPGQKP